MSAGTYKVHTGYPLHIVHTVVLISRHTLIISIENASWDILVENLRRNFISPSRLKIVTEKGECFNPTYTYLRTRLRKYQFIT